MSPLRSGYLIAHCNCVTGQLFFRFKLFGKNMYRVSNQRNAYGT